jgi:F-type H+-transporting ATPase subunit b
MLIDWFTVAAQIVNFLVLIGLLKRFAYKPVLNAIDAREKRIVMQQNEAAAANAAAKSLGVELQKKTAAFDGDMAAMKARGSADIARDREQQMGLARQAAERLRGAEQAHLLEERRSLGDQVAHVAMDALFESLRKALTDLGGVSLDERIVEVFAERLRTLDDAGRNAFKAALAQVPAAAVRSRFALSDAARRRLQDSFDAAMGSHSPLEFSTDPAAIGGIEVSAAGQTISWTVADYLTSLRQRLDVLLDVPAGAAAVAP